MDTKENQYSSLWKPGKVEANGDHHVEWRNQHDEEWGSLRLLLYSRKIEESIKEEVTPS